MECCLQRRRVPERSTPLAQAEYALLSDQSYFLCGGMLLPYVCVDPVVMVAWWKSSSTVALNATAHGDRQTGAQDRPPASRSPRGQSHI
jgi:hypothetical protein